MTRLVLGFLLVFSACSSEMVSPATGGGDTGASGGQAGGLTAPDGTAAAAGDTGPREAAPPAYDGGVPACAQPPGSIWLADSCPAAKDGLGCRTNCRYYDNRGNLLATATPSCVELGTADPRYPELCVADCSVCQP